MRSYPALDPKTPFQRVPFKPHDLTAPVTPIEGLFVLAHLGVPHVDPETWTLTIDGLVRRPMRLTRNELKQRRKRTVEAVHECCGSPLEPLIPKRRVVNVVWGGVALDELLDEARVEPAATFLWSYGLDYGDFHGTSGESFLKDLPLRRVAAGDVLVAFEVNGQLAPRAGWSWQRFRYVWRPNAAGAVRVISRATDHDGAFQPPDGARNAVYGVDAAVAA